MANELTDLELQNAALDAASFASFVNDPLSSSPVVTRTGRTYPNLASYTIGGLHPIGVYDGTVTYAKLDLVSLNGASYVSSQDANTGHNPATQPSAFWVLLSAKGADGAPGTNGTNGTGGGGTGTPLFTGSKLSIFSDSYGDDWGQYWIPAMLTRTGFSAGYMDLKNGRTSGSIFDRMSGGTDAQIITSLQAAFAASGGDAILIELGTNDTAAYHTGIGSPTDDANGSYFGTLNRNYRILQTAFPGVLIMQVGAIQWNYTIVSGLTFADQVAINNAMKTACANKGIPFCNAFETFGINVHNLLSVFSGDGIHLTPVAGYANRWEPLLSKWIMQNCVVGTSGIAPGDPAPTISFPGIAAHNSTDAAFDITAATSNSSGAITYAVSGPATISGLHITLTGAGGSVIVTASQAAVPGSFAAGSAVQSFAVNTPGAVAPTINFTAIADKGSNASPFTTTVTSNSAGAFTYTATGPATVSSSGVVTLTGATGSVTITAHQAAATGFNAGTASRTFNVTLVISIDSTFIAANVTSNNLPQTADGTLANVGSSLFYASNYIACTAGTAVHIAKGTPNAANPQYGVCFYTSAGVFVSPGQAGPITDGQAFTPPATATCFRFGGEYSTISSQAVS